MIDIINAFQHHVKGYGEERQLCVGDWDTTRKKINRRNVRKLPSASEIELNRMQFAIS